MPSWEIRRHVIVQLRAREDDRHHAPHCHVRCGGEMAVYSLDGEIMRGKLSRRYESIVVPWIKGNSHMLKEKWEELRRGDEQ